MRKNTNSIKHKLKLGYYYLKTKHENIKTMKKYIKRDINGTKFKINLIASKMSNYVFQIQEDIFHQIQTTNWILKFQILLRTTFLNAGPWFYSCFGFWL